MSIHTPTRLAMRRRKRRQVLDQQDLERIKHIRQVLRLLDWPPVHQLHEEPFVDLVTWLTEQDERLVQIAAQAQGFDLNKLRPPRPRYIQFDSHIQEGATNG